MTQLTNEIIEAIKNEQDIDKKISIFVDHLEKNQIKMLNVSSNLMDYMFGRSDKRFVSIELSKKTILRGYTFSRSERKTNVLIRIRKVMK